MYRSNSVFFFFLITIANIRYLHYLRYIYKLPYTVLCKTMFFSGLRSVFYFPLQNYRSWTFTMLAVAKKYAATSEFNDFITISWSVQLHMVCQQWGVSVFQPFRVHVSYVCKTFLKYESLKKTLAGTPPG